MYTPECVECGFVSEPVEDFDEVQVAILRHILEAHPEVPVEKLGFALGDDLDLFRAMRKDISCERCRCNAAAEEHLVSDAMEGESVGAWVHFLPDIEEKVITVLAITKTRDELLYE